MKDLFWPDAMRIAPHLSEHAPAGRPKPRYALLINPFYPKDPHASFGKHVLTPTLALTSIAAATPPEWTVRTWDENLLHGAAPVEPFPEVVGITVHLTFARRAYELAAFYRARGESCGAVVHLHSTHATAIACLEDADPKSPIPPLTPYFVMRAGRTVLRAQISDRMPVGVVYTNRIRSRFACCLSCRFIGFSGCNDIFGRGFFAHRFQFSFALLTQVRRFGFLLGIGWRTLVVTAVAFFEIVEFGCLVAAL